MCLVLIVVVVVVVVMVVMVGFSYTPRDGICVFVRRIGGLS